MKVIMYHYVHPLNTNRFLGLNALDLKLFIEQIDFLSKNYNIIDHNIANYYFELNQKLPPNFVLLTFDDGYIDMYRYVLPELVKRKLKGLFYVPNYFQTKKILDVNIIHLLLCKKENINLYLNDIKLIISQSDLHHSFDYYCSKVVFTSRYDSREIEVIKQMLQFLLPKDLRSIIIRILLEKYIGNDMEDLFNQYYCSKIHLDEMISLGMHIGGHGANHLWQGNLTNNEQESEVFESFSFLNSLKKQEFHTYSYPYGSYNTFSIELLKKYNFKFAFTTETNSFDSDKFSKYEIPRFDTKDTYPFNNLV